MNTILIVDDEKPIAQLIEMSLRPLGYACELSHNGEDAVAKIDANNYALIFLDIMLPQIDGYEIFEYIRDKDIPVIFVTAKNTVTDRVKGLRMGADDYIVKPFEPAELLARAEMVLRRSGRSVAEYKIEDVTINTITRSVSYRDSVVALTPMEYELLCVLVRNKGIVLYRDVLYERVWGDAYEDDTRTLDIHIHRLRKKLNLEKNIITVPKVGYRLEAD